MPADLDDLMTHGGPALLDLLTYSVYAVRPELVFVYLAGDYRLAPTAAKALALYDAFCKQGAPARLQADEALEPRELRLRQVIATIRAALAQEGAPAPLPAGALFDAVVAHLRGLSDGPLQTIVREYDPARTPTENLPGGKLTEAARAFVDRIWRPRVRPLLVGAGFWRVATVGG